jgi:hypothetical protein
MSASLLRIQDLEASLRALEARLSDHNIPPDADLRVLEARLSAHNVPPEVDLRTGGHFGLQPHEESRQKA